MNQFFAALILACPVLTILSITVPPPTIIARITPTTSPKSCTPATTTQRPSCTTVQHIGR